MSRQANVNIQRNSAGMTKHWRQVWLRPRVSSCTTYLKDNIFVELLSHRSPPSNRAPLFAFWSCRRQSVSRAGWQQPWEKLTRLAAVASFTLKLQLPPLLAQTAASTLASGKRPPSGQIKEQRKLFESKTNLKLAGDIQLSTGSGIEN